MLIAPQSPPVGQQVMREHDRLGSLEMGVPGQIRLAACHSPSEQRLTKPVDPMCNLDELTLGIQAQVGRDLIVAAATRVQTGARFTSQLSDASLDRRVNVFIGTVKRKRSGDEFCLNHVEGLMNCLDIFHADQTHTAKPGRVNA